MTVASERLRILVVANDVRQDFAHIEQELASIQEAFEPQDLAARVALRFHRCISVDTLVRELSAWKPNLLHIAGRGSDQGEPLFVCRTDDNHQTEKVVSLERLRNHLETARGHLKCVVLNSNFSVLVTQHLVPLIPFTIGSRGEIPDRTALAFSRAFYPAIAAGESVHDAFHVACVHLDALDCRAADLYQPNGPRHGRADLVLLPGPTSTVHPHRHGDDDGAPDKPCILMVAANPVDANPADASSADDLAVGLRREVDSVLELLRNSSFARSVDVEILWDPDVGALESKIDAHQPCIVHFTGFATARGEPVLVDPKDRKSQPLRLAKLQRILRQGQAKGHLRCLVLNATRTANCARLLTHVVPVAIGMDAEVSDEETLKFSRRFYNTLFSGHSLRHAFDDACASLTPNDDSADGYVDIPTIHHREDIDPKQIVMQPAGTSTRATGNPTRNVPVGRLLDLEKMLLDMFDISGFLRFLRGLPDIVNISDEIASDGAPSVKAFSSALAVLHRHGLLDATFFDHLIRERSRREREIRDMMRSLGWS